MPVIAQNIENVRARIAAAAKRAGRKDGDVTLIAVTKTVGLKQAQEAFDLGVSDLAENRPQALRERFAQIPQAAWHLIGHLQTNKVKHVVGSAALIHSVDSLRLLEAVNSRARETQAVQDILLEVNISGEKSKFGLTTEQLEDIINKINIYEAVNLRGLMAMAPQGADEAFVRGVFKRARELSQKVEARFPGAVELSMGMSGDFELAVEEGATMVRLGRALFGEAV